jgi:hypothetical protein
VGARLSSWRRHECLQIQSSTYSLSDDHPQIAGSPPPPSCVRREHVGYNFARLYPLAASEIRPEGPNEASPKANARREPAFKRRWRSGHKSNNTTRPHEQEGTSYMKATIWRVGEVVFRRVWIVSSSWLHAVNRGGGDNVVVIRGQSEKVGAAKAPMRGDV